MKEMWKAHQREQVRMRGEAKAPRSTPPGTSTPAQTNAQRATHAHTIQNGELW